MPYRILRHRKALPEFLSLPPTVRATYERAIQKMLMDPFGSGRGYRVAQLSPPAGLVSPIWSMKVGGYRMFFVVDGDVVKIGGFGARAGFYRKLSRAKELVRTT